jgi:hypothetical protein
MPVVWSSARALGGQPVHGVAITVTNPPSCNDPNVNYGWTVIEGASDYSIKATKFYLQAVKDDFTFTFNAAGYNLRTITRELALNAAEMDIIDENGKNVPLLGFQFDMNSIPSHALISSTFRVVYVDSRKYLVTLYANLYDLQLESDLCYLVLDENYNLVIDEQTCDKAYYTALIGNFLATGFQTETLSKLHTFAQELIDYGGYSYYLAQLRDLLAETAGWLIQYWLVGVFATIENPGKITQTIINNVNNIKILWKTYMTGVSGEIPYFTAGVDIVMTTLYARAMERLHYAGSSFLSLRDTIDSYRGTTRFEYSTVNNMYERWVDPSCNVLTAIDILERARAARFNKSQA